MFSLVILKEIVEKNGKMRAEEPDDFRLFRPA